MQRQMWRRLAGGAVTMLSLAACAPAAPGAGTRPAPAATGVDRAGGLDEPGGVDPRCTRASKVTIAPDGSVAPATLSLRRGAFIAITNRSNTVRRLVAEPDAGLVTSVLGRRERQVVQFPRAGRFTVAAGAGSVRVTVSGDSGCDVSEPTLTITDGYAFAPSSLSVTATANFTVRNRSRAVHRIRCEPDPGGNGDNTRLDEGETQILAFDRPGRYTCRSVQYPDATVTVTVTDR